MRRTCRNNVGPGSIGLVSGVFIILIGSLGLMAISEGADSEQIERAIERELQGREHRWVEVSVEGSVVTLNGRVPDMWARNQAVERSRGVKGVTEIRELLVVPEGESDFVVAEAVEMAIQRYPHYTLWDHVTGRVEDGVVFLEGYVTPERNKAHALFRRLAQVKGVRDIQSTLVTLSPSQLDRRVRHSIARQLRNNIHFERVASMVRPPFHIVVQNGHVTLLGKVLTPAERIELQRLVAHTAGVLRVNNQLVSMQS